MNEDNYDFNNLKNFKYIEAVQKEVTRMFGPINFCVEREAVKTHKLN